MTPRAADDAFTERDRTDADDAQVRGWADRLERLGHLYRYVSLRGERFAWFVDVALRSVMYFPSFKELNDPFDGAMQFTYEGTEQEIRNFWMSKFVEDGTTPSADDHARINAFVAGAHDPAVHKQMHDILDEATARLGVLCFGEVPQDLPMWGYYADAHRGLCLRFRNDLLWRPKWDRCDIPMPVTYEDAYPEVAFYRDTRFRRTDAIVATKAKVWSHEREWRIVRDPHGSMTFEPAALDRVIMGCRIDPDDEDRVRVVLAKREPNVELFKAHEGDREFKLVIEPA